MRTLYLEHNYLTSFPMEETGLAAVPDGVALCLSGQWVGGGEHDEQKNKDKRRLGGGFGCRRF